MALWFTQPLTGRSTSDLPESKARPVPKADNLTANCEPVVYKMWDSRRLTTYGPPRPVTGIGLSVNIFKSFQLHQVLGFTQALTEKVPEAEESGRGVGLTAIYEPIV
jgi:hypothetical protein